jgi:ABC-type nitrate/sulfonate/bicarbonate transport system permease component
MGAPQLWRWLSSLLAFLAILAMWSLTATALSRGLVPGPLVVIRSLCESWQTDPMITTVSGQASGLWFHTYETMFRFFRYLSSGLIVSCLFLLVACFEKRTIPILRQLTWIANPIPPLLLLPIVHAAGCPAAILEWTGGIFYPALAFLSIGLGSFDNNISSLELLMQQAGARRIWLTAHVRWPAVEFALLPSLKTHGAFTLGLTVVVEWMLAPTGLGRVMKYALSFNSGALLLSAVVLTVMIATIYEGLIDILVTMRLRWKVNSAAI